MKHFEEKLSSQKIFDGRVFCVSVDSVRLEDGNVAEREILWHNGGVAIAAITADKDIYLVRQYRYALGQELIELPAGKLERGEDPMEAASRELGEEIGMKAESLTYLGEIYPAVGYSSEIIYLYLAEGLTATEAHPDDDEFLSVTCVPFSEAMLMATDGRIADGKTIAALLMLQAKLV